MKKMIILSLAALMVSACGKDKNNDPIANVKEAAADRDLQNKTFQSECALKPLDAIVTGIFTGGDAAVKSSRTQYRFEGANVTRTTLLYSTANCEGQEAVVFRELGEIDIHQNQKSNDGGKSIDLNYKTLRVEVISPAGVEVANSIKLCGAADWAQGKEREVTANAKDVKCYSATVPRRDANIYRVDANVLYLGSIGKSANAPADRPATLNFNEKFTAK